MTAAGFIGRSLAFVAAVAVATVLGTLVQTQVNLAELARLGVAVPASVRVDATAHDLAGFAPLYAAVVLLAFAIAFPLAALGRRRLGGSATPWFVAAGAVAVAVALLLMPALLGITPVAAARRTAGLVGLVASGALGGWVHARLVSGAGKVPRTPGART